MERVEDDQIAFTWKQFLSEEKDVPEKLNYFAMVKVRKRAIIKLMSLVALISAARTVLCTSRGPFPHLRRTPLHWQDHNIAIAMRRNECHYCFSESRD